MKYLNRGLLTIFTILTFCGTASSQTSWEILLTNHTKNDITLNHGGSDNMKCLYQPFLYAGDSALIFCNITRTYPLVEPSGIYGLTLCSKDSTAGKVKFAVNNPIGPHGEKIIRCTDDEGGSLVAFRNENNFKGICNNQDDNNFVNLVLFEAEGPYQSNACN